MEVSVIGSSQVKIVKTDLAYRVDSFCSSKSNFAAFPGKSGVSFHQSSSRLKPLGLSFSVRAVQTEPAQPKKASGSSSSGSASKSLSKDGVRLYVGLPLDTVSDSNTVNHARAIAMGLKALKLLGVEGVELPVWWGIVEKESMGNYNWSGYLFLAEMIQKAGLKLHVSLCFHASKFPKISLPQWVNTIGEQDPSIFFTDRSGQRYKGCLSLAVDELPVLDGKTPIQVYQDFCESFKSSFAPFIGSTITGISMGLGPNGELRYPSHQGISKISKIPGVGEFQCYDKHMLELLKQSAESSGNACWGLGGPHDAPSYNQTPSSGNFFKDHGGSWESPYGDFFLSWYATELASHGNRLLALASSTFKDSKVEIHGKIPLMSSWSKTRAHPSELTAGFYNTEKRDGYDMVAEVFARNSCKVILPGVDLSDKHQPEASHSSPVSLMGQVHAACVKHGVRVTGQNSSDTGVPDGLEQMQQRLAGPDGMADTLIYQRMGAYFFSPEHFPRFTAFVRNINQPQIHSDDLPDEEEAVEESLSVNSESGIHMQAA